MLYLQLAVNVIDSQDMTSSFYDKTNKSPDEAHISL